MMMRRFWMLLGAIFLLGASLGQAQTTPNEVKPFRLPMASPPGPNTWLIGQFYGNTTDAYNYHKEWYQAGQRLHFGLDFYAPCGTPVVAVGDGTVHAVDAPSFGSDPHNVILLHPQQGVATLYGHLLERPLVLEGQPVQGGEILGYVGDSQGECTARPHLHLEVRSMDFRTTYNPVDYIEAPWHVLAGIGPLLGPPLFQMDMYNTQRWMSVDDQPAIQFGGAPLNNYQRTHPPSINTRPPHNPPLDRSAIALSNSTTIALQPLLLGDGCCAYPWWNETNPNTFYFIAGFDGERAHVRAYNMTDGRMQVVSSAPPAYLSPDGMFQVLFSERGTLIRDVVNSQEWTVETNGKVPSFSTDNSQLLWMNYEFTYIPRDPYPILQIFSSDVDGSNARMIWEQPGGEAMWLDDHRVLIVTPAEEQTDTTLTIFDTSTDQAYQLGRWDWLRGLSVAPGGERLMFYLVWQSNPNDSGIYTIRTEQGAIPEKMPWFGDWRWRDADSVFFLPFSVSWNSGGQQVLGYYNLANGDGGYITDINTQAFQVANADWAVSSTGEHILFQNAADNLNTWMLSLEG